MLETLIKPGERTAIHTHRWPMMVHTLSRSEFVRYDSHGTVDFDSRQSPSAGEPPKAVWIEPLPPHALENVGTGDLHVISIEVKTS